MVGRRARLMPALRMLAMLVFLSGFAARIDAQRSPRKGERTATVVRRPAARPAKATATVNRAAVARAGSRAASQRATARTARKASVGKASAASRSARSNAGRRPRRRNAAPPPPPLPPIEARAPFGIDSLRADLGWLAGTSIRSGSWGMLVVSLSEGDTLYALNPDVPHLTASTQKVLTTALALEALGPQYRYHTDILRTGTLREGVIDGDIVLRGDGDPSLSARFFGRAPDAAMDSLALRVVNAGVREITGRVIGDASAFEARSIPAGWHPRILQDSYAGRVSGLSLNENLVWVTIRPTTRGAPADVVLEPASAGIRLNANVRTVRGRRSPLRFTRGPAGITVTGSIGETAGPRSYSYIVEDPATFTTGAFLSALRRNGVTVANGMTLAPTPTGAEPVASWESAPLETLLTVMNRESVNVIAEHVYRAAARGADRHATGTAFAADTALRALLQRTAGVRADAIRTSDGSGLSQLDRVSPRAMVQLLGWADRSRWGPLFHATLPLAGESGTLRRRMYGTTAQTNLHAKTGTTSDIIALAGYVTAKNGELLAFAMLYNGNDLYRAREAVDAIGVTLANFAR
jgi:serine-type D-Ala-D-Ala carboxypeptidase/endopeptidase (penicillin-binding protein 4)